MFRVPGEVEVELSVPVIWAPNSGFIAGKARGFLALCVSLNIYFCRSGMFYYIFLGGNLALSRLAARCRLERNTGFNFLFWCFYNYICIA